MATKTTKNGKTRKIDSNRELLNVLNFLAPNAVKRNAALAAALVAAENDVPSLEDMPSDEEMEQKFGAGDDETPADDEATTEDAPAPEMPEEGTDEPAEPAEGDAPLDEEAPEEEEVKVGPYDLTFHLRKIISAFDQVTREAEQLRKLTEGITANMSSEQQASWIEQRRFFIETAKEAEQKWSEFKKVLLNFSLTPKIQ